MCTPEGRTKDGWETQFGTNHLGHFLLFQLLKDTLLTSATPVFPGRVVSVSSTGHRMNAINFDNINLEGNYNPFAAYSQSKTANIWFSNEIERRYGSMNLHSTSLHPGIIPTGLGIHMGEAVKKAMEDPVNYNYSKSVEQGSATTIYAALSSEWKDRGGKFLSDCVEQKPFPEEAPWMSTASGDGYKPWAYDPEGEKRLWAFSLEAVGMKDDREAGRL